MNKPFHFARHVLWRNSGIKLRPGCGWKNSSSSLKSSIHHQFTVTVGKRSYYTPLAPPPLFDLCVQRSFDEALERARTHPHEAKFKHPRNWTALHCCVEHVAPLTLVKAIYEANPQALATKDWQGYTPEEAAVDPETKLFLNQQASLLKKEQQQQEQPPKTSNNISVGNSNDPVLVGKLLFHAEQLSDQVMELNKTVTSLEHEIKRLKETLNALTST